MPPSPPLPRFPSSPVKPFSPFIGGSDPRRPSPPFPPRNQPESGDPSKGALDLVVLAFANAKSYKKAKEPSPPPEQNPLGISVNGAGNNDEAAPEVPESVNLALERAKEHKKDKGVANGEIGEAVEKNSTSPGIEARR